MDYTGNLSIYKALVTRALFLHTEAECPSSAAADTSALGCLRRPNRFSRLLLFMDPEMDRTVLAIELALPRSAGSRSQSVFSE